MKDTILNLRRLQDIDQSAAEAARKRDSFQEDIGKLKAILADGERELEEKREKLEEADRFSKELAAKIEEERLQFKRLQARMGALTKSKEYNAAVREIDARKRSISEFGDEKGKLDEQIATYREGVKAHEGKLDVMRAEIEGQEAQHASEMKAIEAEISSHKSERDAVVSKLPRAIVRRYQRIADKRGGVAVVPVSEGQCMGCNRQVMPQLRIRLLKNLTVETCPECSRFLYVPDDEFLRYQQESSERNGDD